MSEAAPGIAELQRILRAGVPLAEAWGVEVREAAAGRGVAVYCQSGMRSYLAHRQLSQAGLDSANLSGGMLTLRATLGPRADELLLTK